MKIKVTQEDIDKGVKEDEKKCPIGRAISKLLPEKNIEVYESTLWIKDGVIDRCYVIPDIANNFIEAFDDDQTVEPFEFECPGLEAEL